MNRLFTGPFIFLAYLVGATAIFTGICPSFIWLIAGLFILFIWDLLFIINKDSFKGRSTSDINDSVTRARTYISWFIGLYGVIIALSLSNPSGLERLATALSASNTPVWLVALPLLLSIISMLFVPFQLGESVSNATSTPNTALKALFFFVIYVQKVVLILIGNIGFRIMSGWT